MFVRPNILRTLRRTMIRFLIEHGSDSPNFTSFSKCLWWDASFGPNLRQTRSRRHVRECRLKSSQVSILSSSLTGNSTNYYLSLSLQDKAAPSTSQQINRFPSKRVKNLVTPSSIFIFIFSSSTGELCSQPIRGNDRRIGRMFPEHVERSFLDHGYSFDEYFQLGSRREVRPIKNQLASPNISN